MSPARRARVSREVEEAEGHCSKAGRIAKEEAIGLVFVARCIIKTEVSKIRYIFRW